MQLIEDPQLVGDREIRAERVFDAPRDLVWKVWTERDHVERWWGPNGFTTTTHAMEVKPGGVWRYVMHGPDGRDYQNVVTYLEVVKPERLSYKHGEPVGGGLMDGETVSFHVTVTFEDSGDRTKLAMRMVFPNAKQRDFVIREHGAVEGLKQHLGNLADYLARAA